MSHSGSSFPKVCSENPSATGNEEVARKGSCGQISLGKTGINKVKLFSILPGLLVFSVLVCTVKLQVQGMVNTASQAYFTKAPFCASEYFSGLLGKTFPDSTMEASQRTRERPQLESYRTARSLLHE